MQTRPVLILGPLADAVVDKLVSDHPFKFVRCQPEYMDCDMTSLEKGVMDNLFVDFKRRGSHYEVTTVSSVKDICEEVKTKFLLVCDLINKSFAETALCPGHSCWLC